MGSFFCVRYLRIFAVTAVLSVFTTLGVAIPAVVVLFITVVIAIAVGGAIAVAIGSVELRHTVKHTAGDLNILLVQGSDGVDDLAFLGVVLADHIQDAISTATQCGRVGYDLAGRRVDDYVIVLTLQDGQDAPDGHGVDGVVALFDASAGNEVQTVFGGSDTVQNRD